MRKLYDDDGGWIVGLIIIAVVLVAIAVILYLSAYVAVGGGALFGGISAIKNYGVSFKKNMIDSNRKGNAA